MSDQGDKTCPLCAEEMDLTDQQLKPCKCGYEICVWCWHHIMDMAEKENTEGRCPACRTPYNKEKIVGMAAKCDKVVAEVSTEKRFSRKGKSKTADSRKQLSSVRVIQRNLVYIVGLPLSLADEDLLQRKEYFSQYGKVMKVSISRTAAGTIQHFANDSCSVYITYSKEEEAVMCIQSVHGFVLDGRPLRACFGTTKYCHAWLRNVPCSNADCLYLHEIGLQEDSFSKDEIISAYTRVQQIAGAINSMQRRSWSVLPPPALEYCSNSSASVDKAISQNAATNSARSVRGSISPPDSSSGGSAALPSGALWETRASNIQHPPVSVPSSNGPLNKKPQMCNPAAFSTAVESTSQVPLLPAYARKKVVHTEESGTTQEKGKIETLEPVKQHAGVDSRTCTSENLTIPVSPASSSMNSQLDSTQSMSLKDKDKHMIPTSSTNALDISVMSSGPGLTEDSDDTTDVKIQKYVCPDMSLLTIGRHQKSQCIFVDQNKEPLPSELNGEHVTSADEICFTREEFDLRLDMESKVTEVETTRMGDDLLTFNEQKHRDPEVIIEKFCSPNLSLSLHSPAQPSGYSPQLTNCGGSVRANMQLDRRTDSISHPSHIELSTNGYQKNVSDCAADSQTIDKSYFRLPDESKRMHVEMFQGEAPKGNSTTDLDNGESSIISNILSLDFDPWNESLTSQNLAKLLGETNDLQGSLRVSSSRKLTSSQSRFSFAREEPTNPSADYQPSLYYIEQSFNHYPHGHNFPSSKNYQLDKIGTCDGFSVANNEETVGFGNSFSHPSSNKLSVSRHQMSAPPGFTAPNRTPPPGFTEHSERMEQNFDSLRGSHLGDTSFLYNLHQAPQVGNVSNEDIAFMDPAILAVGKGRLSNGLDLSSLDIFSSCPPQSNTSENEGRLQLLMQRSLPPHQTQSFADMGDVFSPFGDAYGISPRLLEQTLANHRSSFSQLTLPQGKNSVMSNGHWDSWNGVQSANHLGVSELLRTDNVGFNKFLTGYEESKIHMPSSGSLFNRTFGM
ncbi:unnamed protein product [Withania somnifera]